jgi:hypothetical protein
MLPFGFIDDGDVFYEDDGLVLWRSNKQIDKFINRNSNNKLNTCF